MTDLERLNFNDDTLIQRVNAFNASPEGQRMMLNNIGWSPDLPEIDTSMIDETMQINRNTRETANNVLELQNTVVGLQNDLRLVNEQMEQNRLNAENTTIITDKKNWRNTLLLSIATTVLGAVLGFVLTLISGV